MKIQIKRKIKFKMKIRIKIEIKMKSKPGNNNFGPESLTLGNTSNCLSLLV